MPDPAPLSLRPMQWALLPELPDVEPLDGSDMACIEELRAVLAKHGKLERFALHLAHRHFRLEEGEVLVERADPDGRAQHVGVGRLADYPEAVPTTWLLDDAPELRLSDAVYCVCVGSQLVPEACLRHAKSSSKTRTGQEQDRLSERNHEEEKRRQKTGWPVAGHDKSRER